jgi:predicted Zn-dependent protease
MDRIMREAMTSPESADQFLELQSITEAYFGRLKKSEELMNRAADSARRNGLEQTANLDVAEKIWIRAQFGFSITPPVKNTMSTATWTLYLTALSLAVSGHLEPARAIVDELSKKFPDDTVLNLSALPTIEAAIHLRRNDPARAVQVLQKASSIELGYTPVEMYCVYFRGDALLRLGRGTDAAAEFQKILDHPGVVINSPVTPLAHLGMARARVLEGDNTKARAKYEYFLNLWKDADPDIPVYRQAKAEYAKLKR